MVHITSAIVIRTGATKCRHGVGDETRETAVTSGTDLTMRLSDAGLHQRQTKALYPNHRPPPWLTEDATRDGSNRMLDDCADRDRCGNFKRSRLRR
jgi:hypothetical protein